VEVGKGLRVAVGSIIVIGDGAGVGETTILVDVGLAMGGVGEERAAGWPLQLVKIRVMRRVTQMNAIQYGFIILSLKEDLGY
jgi:hypothetical protein